MNVRANANPLTAIILTILLMLLSGCPTAGRQSPVLQQFEKERRGEFRMSADELSIYVKELSGLYAGVIEEAADEIIQQSYDPAVRRQALLWKMNAIPAAFTAIFHSDPLIALIDVWAFSTQMVNYFDTGPGREAFGEWHEIALRAAKKLESEAMDIARLVRADGNISNAEAFIASWVTEHPIQSHLFTRKSIVLEFSDITAGQRLSGLAAVGKLTYDMDDIVSQITKYSEYLPKQVRWETQLLMKDLLEKEEIIETLQRERALIMQDIDDQRIATLVWFGAERADLMEDTERLIDHFFLRMAQLVIILALLFLIAGVVSIRILRKKSTGL